MSILNWMMKACGVVLLWAMTAAVPHAQTFTTLHSFDETMDGAFPKGMLVQGTDGNLYGTTYAGPPGDGTIFKITPNGAFTTLTSFDGTNGGAPASGLVLATSGDFYGTTHGGGTSPTCPSYIVEGCGTVFKVTPSGTLTALDNFDFTDGALPLAGLTQGFDGSLYGTAVVGGVNSRSCEHFTTEGCGTAFRLAPDGTLTTLGSFDGTDGFQPYGGLVQGSDGSLYGTTVWGGPLINAYCPGDLGCGTVFKITPNGVLTTIHNFCAATNCEDGSEPLIGLVQGVDGSLYGATSVRGANDAGTIFKITTSGTLETIYDFCSEANCPDGVDASYLIQGSDGNFYGTTYQGGVNASGTIFKITPSGTLTTLYSFCSETGCADGYEPAAGLVQATDGAFYGTTEFGGTCTTYFEGCGTVFRLSTGLKPFVGPSPTTGKMGATVRILGTDLAGATSVTFNGTAATFAVDSHSLITTTVPAGATTGKVQVTVPSGALSSNIPFTVRP
jgi:uncharacterized repeat protein (TIGR03803 family)